MLNFTYHDPWIKKEIRRMMFIVYCREEIILLDLWFNVAFHLSQDAWALLNWAMRFCSTRSQENKMQFMKSVQTHVEFVNLESLVNNNMPKHVHCSPACISTHAVMFSWHCFLVHFHYPFALIWMDLHDCDNLHG